MPTVLDLKQERAQVWERMKEIRGFAVERALTAEEEAAWDKAEVDISALDRRIAIADTEDRTAATTPSGTPGREIASLPNNASRQLLTQTAEYRKAFTSYVVNGRLDMEPEERKILALGRQTISPDELRTALNLPMSELRIMQVQDNVSAGYLVPDEYERTLLQNMLAFGGMREVATIRPTDNGADWIIPSSDDTGNTGELLSEGATVAYQDVTTAQRTLKAFMYSSRRINASYQLLQDSAFGIESWLSGLMAERIARITNTHFTLGVGPNQPSGIVNDAGTGVTGATGQTTSVTWDDLINLEHAVDPAYRRNCRFMFRDSTLQYIRRLKDGEGRYLWQPSVTVGAPGTINGWPYTINQDVAAMAASARSILFGDFSKYWIRDVRGFFLVRMDEVYAPQAQVGFIGFSRHDGTLINTGTNPVQPYINAAS